MFIYRSELIKVAFAWSGGAGLVYALPLLQGCIVGAKMVTTVGRRRIVYNITGAQEQDTWQN